uniref:Uncharacterized protein n=1 Tax=Siphoviridae sp. ctl0E3 TaxID=2827586 RepID=A0A8S5LNW0_9CAUD|nr:MAG TPA: hypothetical protein [Siphoviridae sp. ctl0E3]
MLLAPAIFLFIAGNFLKFCILLSPYFLYLQCPNQQFLNCFKCS